MQAVSKWLWGSTLHPNMANFFPIWTVIWLLYSPPIFIMYNVSEYTCTKFRAEGLAGNSLCAFLIQEIRQSKQSLEISVNISKWRAIWVIRLWTFPVAEYLLSCPECVLASFRERALSREYAVTDVYDILRGSKGSCLQCLCGKNFGRRDYIDLINYCHKNSKHH